MAKATIKALAYGVTLACGYGREISAIRIVPGASVTYRVVTGSPIAPWPSIADGFNCGNSSFALGGNNNMQWQSGCASDASLVLKTQS